MSHKPGMVIRATGAAGFVMGNTVSYLLESDQDAKIIILDLAPVAGGWEKYFAPVIDRVISVQGDIRDGDLPARSAKNGKSPTSSTLLP